MNGKYIPAQYGVMRQLEEITARMLHFGNKKDDRPAALTQGK
jgi:hypothetical protein